MFVVTVINIRKRIISPNLSLLCNQPFFCPIFLNRHTTLVPDGKYNLRVPRRKKKMLLSEELFSSRGDFFKAAAVVSFVAASQIDEFQSNRLHVALTLCHLSSYKTPLGVSTLASVKTKKKN